MSKRTRPRPAKPAPAAKVVKPPKEDPHDEMKRRIVMELARFQSTTSVRAMLLEEYEVDWSTQDIIRYDASKAYCVVGHTLRELFHQVRKDYCTQANDIPISQIAYRLNELQTMAQQAKEKGDYKLAAELLEQAAKDYGGIFTNVRQVNGEFKHRNMTPAEARETINQGLAQYLEQIAQKADAKKDLTKH